MGKFMKDMDDIKKKNEEIARKFIKIETALPSFPGAKELFEKVLLQLEGEFDIPFVWISIINRHYLTGVIQALKTSKIIKDRLNIIDEATFFTLIADGTKPVLTNDGLKPFFKLFPRKKKYFIRSLAIAPITLHQEIIGSLNHGDFSSLRYHPDMDTTLLRRLASNISIRLSEIIPRKNMAAPAADETGKAD
jgi:uncharacterized protein YigA (DUF484 family)